MQEKTESRTIFTAPVSFDMISFLPFPVTLWNSTRELALVGRNDRLAEGSQTMVQHPYSSRDLGIIFLGSVTFAESHGRRRDLVRSP